MRIFLLFMTVVCHSLLFSQYGGIDTGFNMAVGFDQAVRTSAFTSDEKLLVGGDFINSLGATTNHLVCLNQDGTIDNSFSCLVGGPVNKIVVTPDDKIYIGGNFSTVNGVSRKNIARLNSDGSLDTDFVVGSGFNDIVKDIKLLPSGRLYVTGAFTTYNGGSASRIVRLRGNGELDNTFFITGNGFNNAINSVDVFSDGKLIVGGNFTTLSGNTVRYIARLNADGTFDNDFTTSLNNYATRVQVVSGDKVFIGGEFTQVNTSSISRLVRIDYNGTIDNTFNIGSGFASIVQDFIAEPSGKIIAVGNFTSFNGQNNSKHIVRITTSGSMDNTFNPGGSFSNPAVHVNIQPDGKIVVGGIFTAYNNTMANRFVRINNCLVAPTGTYLENIVDRVGLDEFRARYVGTTYQWYDCSHNAINGATNRSFSPTDAGDYYVEITTSCGKLFSTCIHFNCYTAAATDNVSACYSYIWIDGVEYFASNNTATYLIPNTGVGGCDSLVQLNLIIDDILAPVEDVENLPEIHHYCSSQQLVVPTATDACAGTINGVLTGGLPTTPGTHTIEWTYDDGNGNITFQEQTYIVESIDYEVTANGTLLSTTMDGEGITYQWVRCDMGYLEIPGAINASYTVTENGVYAVDFFVDGCIFSSNCHTIDFLPIVGLNELEENYFVVYPNPTNGNLSIDFKAVQWNSTIEVIDMLGQVIDTIAVENASHVHFEVKGDAGMYTVRILSDEGISIQHVSVIK